MVPPMVLPVARPPASPLDGRGRSWMGLAGILVGGLLVLSACGSPGPSTATPSGRGHRIEVVAAENFWGSIASQVGGVHARVVSIITNPNTDPHAYEPTAGDARTLAGARLVVENGIGYDPWVPKLLAADQGGQKVLDVGDLLGIADGGNPHRWYNPGDVRAVVTRLTSDFSALDPSDRSYFTKQADHFEQVTLRPYDTVVSSIRAKYAGTAIGASESIFAMVAPALGLDLITPPTFLKAISEGSDVSVGDKRTIDNQIKDHLIKIYVYNSQNVTPDVQAQLNEVKAEHIPVATITETLQPAKASYEAWQTKQLVGVETALARAHG
jgi:zinc/manganese transport system substrate-binding protein